MHRAYQPIFPTANLYLQDKWDRNRYKTHRKKVAMAVPAVDTKGSETPAHLLVNMKKIQMNKELQSLIEKQNLMHSKKLSAIHQSHGRVDNWNFYPQRSLNAAHQRQNVNTISYENGKILERILRRESEYGRWESEWEKVKRIQANISRYPQVTWAGQHRVTFMDSKRNSDIHHLFEGSETDSAPSRSTIKLDSIPKRADHERQKGHLNLPHSRKGLTPIQAEMLVDTESENKASCNSGKGSPYRIGKRGTVITATLEKPNDKNHGKSASDQKSFTESNNCVKEQKDSSQAECMSEKSQPCNVEECETKLKNSRKIPMSYESSDETFDSSHEDSDASSCYSFQGSEKSSSSSKSSRMSEILSSQSINLKARMTSTSSTSLRSVGSGTSHKQKISNTQYVYSGHDPSSQESSTSRRSVRHSETPEASFHRLEVSDRQNVYSRKDMSLDESEESNYDTQQRTNRSAGSSDREPNSSLESFVIYTQKWPI